MFRGNLRLKSEAPALDNRARASARSALRRPSTPARISSTCSGVYRVTCGDCSRPAPPPRAFGIAREFLIGCRGRSPTAAVADSRAPLHRGGPVHLERRSFSSPPTSSSSGQTPTEEPLLTRYGRRRLRPARLTDGCETPRPTSPRAAPRLGTRPRFGSAHVPPDWPTHRGGVRVLVHCRRRHRPPHQAPRTRPAPGARRPVNSGPIRLTAPATSSPATDPDSPTRRTPPARTATTTSQSHRVHRSSASARRSATASSARGRRRGLGPEARTRRGIAPRA